MLQNLGAWEQQQQQRKYQVLDEIKRRM